MAWTDWPEYSWHCRWDYLRLLRNGRGLSAYRANPLVGVEPAEGSWAWRAEALAAQVHHIPNVIMCSSGTTALMALLRALRLPPGEIITTAFTFSATAAAILRVGHRPVFADVDPETYTLDATSVSKMLSRRTRAILAVDLFGRLAEYWALTALGPLVIADACQAVGLPPRVDCGVWSFNGRKNVPAGEGGAVFTRNVELAHRVRQEINHGENFPFEGRTGENGRMPEPTACLVTHGLRRVVERNWKRTVKASGLNRTLQGSRVRLPALTAHALYVYPLRVLGNTTRFEVALTRQGIQHQAGYIRPPLHQYPAFSRCLRDALPVTEALSSQSLFVFPQVTPTATTQEMRELAGGILAALR